MIGTERFWKSKWGNGYRARNRGERLVKSNLALFGEVLRKVEKCSSVLELGAGSGMNVGAVRSLIPDPQYYGVEIHGHACEDLAKLGVNVWRGSILDYKPEQMFDLVFTKGVLIHIPPEYLHVVYDLMYLASRRYVALIEYHSPKPEDLPYPLKKKGRLWKRDFCADLMARHPDLKLIDYGFLYGHDEEKGQGEDLNWFLLEKPLG